MKKFFIVLSIFSCGYMFSDICRELGFTLSEKAYAYDSLDESDVQDIIEDCDVKGFYVDGYVEDDYFSTYVSRQSITCY